MFKLLVIAHREYAAMVATRAFLVTLIMMPVLMFGGLIVMPKLGALSGGKTERIVVADETGKLLPVLQAAAEARNAALRSKSEKAEGQPKNEVKAAAGKARDQFSGAADFYEIVAAESPSLSEAARLKLSDEIRAGKLYAFIEIPAAVLDDASTEDAMPGGSKNSVPSARFVSQDALLSSGRQWVAAIVSEQVRVTRLNRLGLDPSAISRASRPIEFTPMAPIKPHEAEKARSDEDMLVQLLLPFGIMMLMFMVIFLAAQPMLESGMEEKSHRIAEVLLGSVSPTQLMAGKLLGNVAGSLMIFAIYGIGGWVVLQRNGWASELPMTLLPWFLVFQLLGVLFFSSIFLTVGASISELKEAQGVLMPIWLVMLAPMMIWIVVLRDPNGIVAVAMSMFPPSAPLMMMLRLSSGQTIPWWQAPLSAAILIAATALVVKGAGRIYRASLLRTDSARSLWQFLGRLR